MAHVKCKQKTLNMQQTSLRYLRPNSTALALLAVVSRYNHDASVCEYSHLSSASIPLPLTVGCPAGMCDADRVAGVVGGIGLKQFHAVRRVSLGGKLGHHKFLVVVYGAHTG